MSLFLVCAHPLFQFEAFELAGGGAGQRVLPDFVAANALGGRNLGRDALNIEANDFLGVDDSAFFQNLEVRHHYAVEPVRSGITRLTLERHDRDFLYVGGFQIVGLNLLGIYVLAVAQHDHVFLATGDKQIAARVEVAEITGMEPAILENSGGGIRSVPIALHHNGALDGNFTDSGSAILPGLWIDNLSFHTGQGRSDRTDHVVMGQGGESGASGFGQTVGLQHVDTEGVEVVSDLRIEARTAGDQIAHAIAEGAVEFAEKDSASVASNRAQAAIHRHQGLQCQARDFAAFGYFLKDALVNEVEKLRYHGKNRDLPFVERAQQLGGVQRFQIDDPRSFHQRQQEIGHLGEHMEERQHPEDGVLRTNVRPAEHRFNFSQQIGVREHHALGIGSCAGGVEQGGYNIGLYCRRREAARAQGKDAVKIGHRGGRSLIGTVS